jgi:serine/threonine-protein kinase
VEDETKTSLNLRGPGRKIISHYRLEEFLGEGGMGVVWKAEDMRLKRPVAIKFLPTFDASSEEAKQRFHIEAQAAAALDHPSVCTIYEIDEDAGCWFMAMAYVEGESVARKLRSGPLDVALAVKIAAEVADGLSAAHARNVIHRDIKAGNIMVTPQKTAKILDFGLARVSWAAGLTRSGVAVGTPSYMAPEQVAGRKLDHRTDIWALGVVLYEMLAGHAPFREDYREALFRVIVEEPPAGLRSRRPEIPEELERIVFKALAKDPAGRFQTAAEMRDALRGEQQPVPTSSSSAFAHRPRPAATVPSIAVLPFANLTSDPENEFFTDGLTDEIIGALAQLKSVRVVSRTSVFALKGNTGNIKEVGERLRVTSVLEGSMRRAGSRVRINVQLVNVEDGFPTWSERYDDEMSDIFRVQEQIARKVVESLRITLQGESRIFASHYQPAPEVYRLYLQGRYHMQQLNPVSFVKAREYFEKAIGADPEYAPAYSGLARYFTEMTRFNALPPLDALSKGQAAARKALELDEDLAEAHAALGEIVLGLQWDWAGAERQFREAVRLAPGDASVRQPYAAVLSRQGRFDEAYELLQKALDLDPLSKPAMNSLAHVYFFARRWPEALETCGRILEIDSTYMQALGCQGLTWSAQGRREEALGPLASCRRLSRDSAISVAYYAYGCGVAGHREEARALLDDLMSRSKTGYISPASIAVVNVGLGDYEMALERLLQAVEEHDATVQFLGVLPALDALREDPQFRDLLTRIGLPAGFHPSMFHMRSGTGIGTRSSTV